MRLIMPRLSEVLNRFLVPLRKRPLTIWSVTIIIVAVLYVWTGVQGLISLNCRDTAFMAAELLQESGPNYVKVKKDHEAMLRLYIRHMEKRHLSSVLRLLYPDHTPYRQFGEALAILEKPLEDDQLASRQAIWRAGEHLTQLYLDSKASAGREVKRSMYERLPPATLRDLNNELTEAHEAVKKLEFDPTFENAQSACMANRRVILLLFLVRFAYDDTEQIDKFRHVVYRTIQSTMSLADTTQGPEADLLRSYAESENRRVSVIQAMLDGDDEKVNALVKETIRKAVEYDRGNWEN